MTAVATIDAINDAKHTMRSAAYCISDLREGRDEVPSDSAAIIEEALEAAAEKLEALSEALHPGNDRPPLRVIEGDGEPAA